MQDCQANLTEYSFQKFQKHSVVTSEAERKSDTQKSHSAFSVTSPKGLKTVH